VVFTDYGGHELGSYEPRSLEELEALRVEIVTRIAEIEGQLAVHRAPRVDPRNGEMESAETFEAWAAKAKASAGHLRAKLTALKVARVKFTPADTHTQLLVSIRDALIRIEALLREEA